MIRTTCSEHQDYMKQRESTVNKNVTYSVLVKTRRYGNYSTERIFGWKQPLDKFTSRTMTSIVW